MMCDTAIYIHIPFCLRKCYYCDFASASYDPTIARAYIDALEKEATHYIATWPMGKKVSSIYIGGGTPTTLSVEELERVLKIVNSFPKASDFEWTVEANPGTLNATNLALLKDFGVNRLSLGVQSFDDDVLEFLGRVHKAYHVKQAWALARNAGFDNMSLDLIYAIPGLSLRVWHETLKECVALGPRHVSAYSLIIEEGTEFARRRLQPCPEELDLYQYQLACEMLERAGLYQYEISNYAKPGFTSKHNLVYWHNEPYVGLGCAATSYLDKTRYTNVRDTQLYCKLIQNGKSPIAEREMATLELEKAETVMLGLRLKEGLERQRFHKRFGQDIYTEYSQIIDRYVKLDLIALNKTHLSLTAKGFLLYNQIVEAFLPDLK